MVCLIISTHIEWYNRVPSLLCHPIIVARSSQCNGQRCLLTQWWCNGIKKPLSNGNRIEYTIPNKTKKKNNNKYSAINEIESKSERETLDVDSNPIEMQLSECMREKNDENHFQTIVHRPCSSMSMALLFSPVHENMHNMYQINDYAHKFSLSRLAFESLQINGGRRKQVQMQRTNEREKSWENLAILNNVCLCIARPNQSAPGNKTEKKRFLYYSERSVVHWTVHTGLSYDFYSHPIQELWHFICFGVFIWITLFVQRYME